MQIVHVPVKDFWKSVNIWRRYGQWQSGKFFETRRICWWHTANRSLDNYIRKNYCINVNLNYNG